MPRGVVESAELRVSGMRVGFIGLGKMGSGIAMNLLGDGHQLVVHDLGRELATAHLEAGASWADSPREAAASSEVVFLSLPGPQEVERAALGAGGLIEGAHPGQVCFDLTTNSPTLIRRLHGIFLEREVDFLDAPVSGGPWGAASRRMAIWVGGRESAYQRHLDLLQSLGDEVFYIGPSGAGVIAKLVHNCTGFVLYATLAETFSVGIKAGLEPDVLWQALRQGVLGRRPLFDCLVRNFLPGHYDPPDFALELAAKDVGLAVELGTELGVPMALADRTLEDLRAAVERGWGGRDARAAMLLQLERAGLDPLEVPEERIEAMMVKPSATWSTSPDRRETE